MSVLSENIYSSQRPKESHVNSYGRSTISMWICNKRFTLNGHLKRHRRTHATENQHSLYKPKGCSSVKQWEHHAGTQTHYLELHGQSSTNPSALTCTGVIDEPHACMLRNLLVDSTEENSSIAKHCIEDCVCISIAKSPNDGKPFLQKSFGCGMCWWKAWNWGGISRSLF